MDEITADVANPAEQTESQSESEVPFMQSWKPYALIALIWLFAAGAHSMAYYQGSHGFMQIAAIVSNVIATILYANFARIHYLDSR